VARIRENRNIYGIMIRKAGGKRTIERHRHRQGYRITVIMKAMGWFGVDSCGLGVAGCCKHGNDHKLP